MVNSKKYVVEATADEQKPIKNGDPEKHIGIDVEKYVAPKEPHWLLQRIFILTWIKSYDREKAIADLIAGITLGMTIIPQSIAYAALAGLSSEYGLYSAFIGSMMYVFFGTIPQVSIGPTSLMSLMTLQFCADKPIQFVVILAFMSGLVELLMGIFQLGVIISFIPAPVNKAFTTATAIIVGLVQVKNLLGVKIKGHSMPGFCEFFKKIRLGDSIMGISCLIILLSLKQLGSINFKNKSDTFRRIKKILWYISISRNALVVFFCSLFAFLWIKEHSIDTVPFALSSKVDSAMVAFHLPPFAFEYNNSTMVFTDIIRELGSAIVVVPIVAILANVAIAKAFVKDGKLDATQEMLSLGICNLAGSFFSAMPTCGAFSRSAVSNSSGVRTPMAGIYTGLIVLSALSILTPYFQYIPKSTLAAVLIAAVAVMVDLTPMKILWSQNKKDFFSWTGCLIICLIAGVEIGLFCGIIINMIFVLLRLGNPKVEAILKECDDEGYIHIIPNSDIYYTGVDFLCNKIREACVLYKNDFPVVVDCTRFMQFDATFIEVISAVAKELEDNKVLLVLHQLQPTLQLKLAAITNIRFCDDALNVEDLKVKESST